MNTVKRLAHYSIVVAATIVGGSASADVELCESRKNWTVQNDCKEPGPTYTDILYGRAWGENLGGGVKRLSTTMYYPPINWDPLVNHIVSRVVSHGVLSNGLKSHWCKVELIKQWGVTATDTDGCEGMVKTNIKAWTVQKYF